MKTHITSIIVALTIASVTWVYSQVFSNTIDIAVLKYDLSTQEMIGD